jgi:SAM-dependent methyltransferase
MLSENFDSYSAYYDLLYKTKDYKAEAAFINDLIREYLPSAESILDLGCGTGIHDWLFAKLGYSVVGVDQSNTMLDRARGRLAENPTVGTPPYFQQGNLKEFSSQSRVDVVVSLFDVVSYLTSYDDLRCALGNIRESLNPTGLLIFDCWYGPAVYTQRPQVRLKKLEDDRIRLTRIASSDFLHEHNRINVLYDVFVEDKHDGSITTFSELHPMRCYFSEELSSILNEFGFAAIFQMEWFTRNPPSLDTWSVLYGYRITDAGNPIGAKARMR